MSDSAFANDPPARLLTLLRGHPFFAGLPDSRIALLARRAVRREFLPGEAIFMEGEPSAGLWLIDAGSVKAFKIAADGREHILHLLGPGDTFNDIPALDGRPNAASAAALTAVATWTVPSPVLVELLQSDHDLALAVIQSLAGRIRHLVVQIEDLALRSVAARLARFLLEQAENPSLSAPGITRATMAAHLATTPETISRALRALEDAGAIHFDRHRIVIAKADLLRQLAMM